jgi:hypothetical protein
LTLNVCPPHWRARFVCRRRHAASAESALLSLPEVRVRERPIDQPRDVGDRNASDHTAVNGLST